MKKLVFIFLSVLLIGSCDILEIGDWKDNIKLSTKDVEFGFMADSITISTEGDSWSIDEVTFNDSSYSYNCDEDIDFESYPYAIVGDNFVVERRDKNALFIKLDENTSGTEREMRIVLQAGNYFDYVVVKQSTP